MTAAVRPALPTFRDRALDDQFWARGFVTFPLLDDDDLRAVAERWAASRSATPEPFETSALHVAGDPAARAMHEDLTERFTPKLAGLFADHAVRHGYIMEKGPVDPHSAAGEVPLHQDWTFVDEVHSRGVLLWCPLVDVSADGGRLRVVPGSHRASTAPRGPEPMPWALAPVADELRRHLETVSVPRGHALAYDGALVHASGPNHDLARRPVIGVGVTHRLARHVTFHPGPDGSIRRWEVEPSHFSEADLLGPPPGSPGALVSPEHEDPETLAARIRRLAAPS